jgi:hypothetical protein
MSGKKGMNILDSDSPQASSHSGWELYKRQITNEAAV